MDKRDILLEESFSSCELFSLALDTALFRQEHILSCVARFVFKDCMTQFPLFFSVYHASTGEEMGRFVFQKLKRMGAPFEKLSSVTTDGANNMVGKRNGMVCHLTNLTKQETGHGSVFQNIWCLSHRLNLVVRGFGDVEHIRNELKFADWFSGRRKAVAYKRWLSEAFPDRRNKKIPKPSETRWSFYREVIGAILSQRGDIEQFLKQDEDFISSSMNLWGEQDTSHRQPPGFFC